MKKNEYILYDFDGTIYDGDSGVDIIKFALKNYPKTRKRMFKMLGVGLKYLFKLASKEEMKNVLFSFLQDIDDVDDFVSKFWEKHECKLKKFWLDKKHNKDIIISASGYFWLKPIADKYKVFDLFATDIDKNTGYVNGKNSHGKQKVINFYEKYPNGIVLEMYTDSINDLPLIEEAKTGYLVKKNKLYKYYDYKPNFIVRFWRWCWGIYHKNEELWNYLIVGGLTTVVGYLSKVLLTISLFNPEKPLELQYAVVLSNVIAIVFAYLPNRIYVFKSKNNKIFKEFCTFFGSRVSTILLDMSMMWFFVTLLHLNYYVFALVTNILVIILNYLFSKIFVFKKEQ